MQRTIATRIHHPVRLFNQGFLKRILSFQALWQQRQALASMSDEQLVDLGLTRQTADLESARPIWDAPAHWRC